MDEIINYIMNSPENTNPNVLKGILEQQGGAGSSIIIDNDNSLSIRCIRPNGNAGELDIIIYDFTNWLENPQPIFIKNRGEITFQIGYYDDFIGPVDSNDYAKDELCLTVEKEVLITNDFNDNKFYLIKNNNDIVPGTGENPK